MDIRAYQRGDEDAQVEVYNAAAARLPHFKPAASAEVERRGRALDFSPEQRLYALADGRVVGYGVVNANGRISYPWCLPGFEHAAEPLFSRMIESARIRGLRKVFAAYRDDWPVTHEFFRRHGLKLARTMVNFLAEFVDVPTPADSAESAITPLLPADVPVVYLWMPDALRIDRPEKLHDHLFKNEYFSADALFALRGRHGEPLAVGVLVYDPNYADPHAVNASMPCFRLGAFGTEGMQAKRLKGLFSFLARPGPSLPALALDLMGHAVYRLRAYGEVTALAGQVASDAPALLAFYERNFQMQGSFPVFEMTL